MCGRRGSPCEVIRRGRAEPRSPMGWAGPQYAPRLLRPNVRQPEVTVPHVKGRLDQGSRDHVLLVNLLDEDFAERSDLPWKVECHRGREDHGVALPVHPEAAGAHRTGSRPWALRKTSSWGNVMRARTPISPGVISFSRIMASSTPRGRENHDDPSVRRFAKDYCSPVIGIMVLASIIEPMIR